MGIATSALRRLLVQVWPPGVVDAISFETRASIQHFRSWLSGRSKFKGKKHLKVNIGCGNNTARDWVNLDLGGPPEVFRWDCRRGLPFDENAVDAVFAEHVFEHLDPETGTRFLSECRRCLRPGGVVRIIVPDAGRYIGLYQGPWQALADIRPLSKDGNGYKDQWLNRVYRTKMEFINEVFRQGAEHKYAYDDETLILKFRDAGFNKIILQSYGVSVMEEPPLDTPARGNESLYVEAIKE